MPKYSDEQWRTLTNANAVEVAEALGLEIDLKTSDRKAFHIKGYGGLFIWKDGSGFYHSSENVKGNSVALVQHIKKCSYREALDFINENVMNGSFSVVPSESRYKSTAKSEEDKAKNFTLPKCDHKMARAYAYLIQRRKIDPDIVKYAAGKGMIIQDAQYGNVGFVGMDKSGAPKYCALRGTLFVPNAADLAKHLNLCVSSEETTMRNRTFYRITNRSYLYISDDKSSFYDSEENCYYTASKFVQKLKDCTAQEANDYINSLINSGACSEINPFKGEVAGSDKRYGFCIQGTSSRKLIIFESAIDALSYATLQKAGRPKSWKNDTKLSLGGCSINPLEQHLSDYPNCYDEIQVCTDNDKAGNTFAETVRKQYSDRFEITRHAPAKKDWNEDLKNISVLFEQMVKNAPPETVHLTMKNAVTRYYAHQDENICTCEAEL